jgi:hypothetical protein
MIIVQQQISDPSDSDNGSDKIDLKNQGGFLKDDSSNIHLIKTGCFKKKEGKSWFMLWDMDSDRYFFYH